MTTAQHFYDSFAAEYNLFVNWPARLAKELPFLVNKLNESGTRRVLDVAGGTGQHAMALAQAGFKVTLADISPGMLDQARRTAHERNLPLEVQQAGFGGLRSAFAQPFDALICLGNSIPHVLDTAAMQHTLADMAAVLAPGGLMIWQLRNFTHVLAAQERFMGPQSGGTPEDEWLFVRFYDFIPPHVCFNMLRLRRTEGKPWEQHLEQTLLYPWVKNELEPLLKGCGWGEIRFYGNLAGDPYDEDTSSDLVVVTRQVNI